MNNGYILNKIIKSKSDKELEDLIKTTLELDSFNKLFEAMCTVEDSYKQSYFDIKEYNSAWKHDFEEQYGSLDRKLVEERLEECKNGIDFDTRQEYTYLSYWYQQQMKVGGLFNDY